MEGPAGMCQHPMETVRGTVSGLHKLLGGILLGCDHGPVFITLWPDNEQFDVYCRESNKTIWRWFSSLVFVQRILFEVF
jgi:hypothetical protein